MEKTGGHMVIIKAQIHAGGRGKGRFLEHPDAGLAGVNVVASGQTSLMAERMTELAEKMLGSTLVTVQTGPSGKVVNRVLLQRLVTAAGELDTELLEINPLVINASGQALALDAKLSFEDNALHRHPEIAGLRDESEEEPAETVARKAGLNYVKLDGRIGCMVNGAGLAMATMDTVEHYGGSPANFLDVGGDTDEARVATGFRIITADPNVRGIFVNIFGGIVHCDVIAKGVLAATEQVGLSVPLVVRLEGTNVELGRRIIAESGLGVISATNMAEGARRIVELCR